MGIGDTIIMYADAMQKYTESPLGMFVYVESVDTIYNIAVLKGNKSPMLPAKMEYAYMRPVSKMLRVPVLGG
jgi:PhnB protein